MTYRKFRMIYNVYKSEFDLELLLAKTVTTYEKCEKETDIDDVIPF